MKTIRILFALSALTLITAYQAGEAWAHPFHVTLAEAELEAKTGHLEVAIRVKPEDLERALSALTKRKISLEKEAKVDALILNYLRGAIRFIGANKKPAKMSFVGKELSRKALWIYFEVDLGGQLEGVKVENRVFFKVLPDQLNTMNFKQGKKRCSLSFSRKFPSRTVRLVLPKTAAKKKE